MQQPKNRQLTRLAQWILLGTSCIAVIAMFALFLGRFPIAGTTLAMDWKTFWPSLQGGDLQYLPMDGLRFPPWSLVPLLPLGFLPMQTSWGVLAGISVVILLASVPRTGSRVSYWSSVLLGIVSFPSLRNIADGNMESFVVGGVVLILNGYVRKSSWLMAMGILIATIKLQEITLFVLVLILYLLQTWRSQDWLKTVGLVSVSVILSLLWRGQAWVIALLGPNYQKYTGSIIDISVIAALKRLGFIPITIIGLVWLGIFGITLFLCWKSRAELSREKAGLLIAGSLLIAPYAAGNSVLSLLAIGVIPLFQQNQILGGMLIALVNIPFLFPQDMLYNFQAYYWTMFVFLVWLTLTLRCLLPIVSKEQCENPA